ncbi:MAG: hypothetical protein K9W43_11115 [Candidatus Thorarchaeota archaeon]|nr:hypothetical protein [Candidatus Thorarchaeota archaeon]
MGYRQIWKFLIISLFVVTAIIAAMDLRLYFSQESYLITSDRSYDSVVNVTYSLKGGHSYDLEFCVVNTNTNYGEVLAPIAFVINGTKVWSGTLQDTSRPGTSTRKGVSAKASAKYSFHADTNVTFWITGVITKGEYWTVTIYKDLPQTLKDDIVKTSIALFVAGVSAFVLLIGYAQKYGPITLSGSSQLEGPPRTDDRVVRSPQPAESRPDMDSEFRTYDASDDE